jgi:hypothetical protein
MRLEDLESKMYKPYGMGDAEEDGAKVIYLEDDDVPEYDGWDANDFVVITDDAGPVLCRLEAQGLLCEIDKPSQLLGAEGFNDQFVNWLKQQ